MAPQGEPAPAPRGWLRPLTDRRVGTKIMIAVVLVALFSVFDGLFALNSLGTTNDQVKTVYGHSIELETIGSLRSAVNQTWLAADDYLLATDAAGRSTAAATLTTAQAQVTADAATYSGYQLGTAAAENLAAFDDGWTRYLTLLRDQLMPLAERGDTAGVAALRAGGQAPLLSAIRTALGALSSITVDSAAAQESTAERLFQSTRTWVIILLVPRARCWRSAR